MRATREDEIPEFEEFKYEIISIPNTTTRALIAFLFLTGRRISEVVGRKPLGERPEVPAIKKKQIVFKKMMVQGKEMDIMWIYAMPILKKKGRKLHFLDFPVLANARMNEWAVDIVYEHIEALGDEQRIFPFSRQKAWRRIKIYTEQSRFCHYYRNAAATYHVREQDWGILDLINKFQWSSWDMAMRYVKYRTEDLLLKQLK